MSKTSIFLLFIFLIIIGIFAYIKTTHPYTAKPPTIEKISKPIQTRSDSTLSFLPAVVTVRPGTKSSIAIHLNVQGDIPTLVQFEIGYDPQVITPLSIIPGQFFINPTTLLNTMTPGSGRISYAIQCADAKDCINQETKTVATIAFSVNPYSIKKQTTLTFFPKTLLQTVDGTQVLLKTQNAQVKMFGNIQPAATASAGIKPL